MPFQHHIVRTFWSAPAALLLFAVYPVGARAQESKWIHQFGTSNDDQGRAVLAAGSSVYVAGWTIGELPGQRKVGRQDSYLRKYDGDGKELWTRQFSIGTYSEGRSIAASATEVYLAGAMRDDGFVRKFDASGKELWTRQIGTASDADDQILGIALDPTGVYVAGSTADVLPDQTSAGNADAFVRKYDPEGKEMWTRQFGSSSFDQARGIAVNVSGIYVAGLTAGVMPGTTGAGAHDVFVRKYDAHGKELWTRQFGTSDLDDVCAIAVDESGVYVAGTTRGALPNQNSAGGADIFVRKYDAGGNEMWTRQFGTGEYDQARAMSVHESGVYVTGWTLGSIPRQAFYGMHDALIVRFSTAGELTWTHQFGSSNLDDPFGISVDASGIYLAGLTGGKLPGQRNAGNVDAFVAKLESAPAAGR